MKKNWIELKKGESIKIIGQRETCIVAVNINGEIFTRTDSRRLEEEDG